MKKNYKYDNRKKYNLELFLILFNLSKKNKFDVVLVKVFIKNFYEVLGYFGMGGYNDCFFLVE